MRSLTKIGFGSIVGSLRRTDPEKSWMDESGDLAARPFLSLDEDQPMTPGEQTTLDVPLGPTVWSIEPGHSLVVRISTHAPDGDCVGLIVPPVGCYPTKPMLDTLAGGTYSLHVGGKLGSLISLPLLDHGALQTTPSVASPTGDTAFPLPNHW